MVQITLPFLSSSINHIGDPWKVNCCKFIMNQAYYELNLAYLCYTSLLCITLKTKPHKSRMYKSPTKCLFPGSQTKIAILIIAIIITCFQSCFFTGKSFIGVLFWIFRNFASFLFYTIYLKFTWFDLSILKIYSFFNELFMCFVPLEK